MPKASLAEIYFVAGMMGLTVIITVVSIYFFMKTYRKEMREKEERKRLERLAKSESAERDGEGEGGAGSDA